MRAASILMVLVLGVGMSGTTPALAADHPLDPSDQEVADAIDYLRDEQDSDGSIGDFATSAWAAMAIAAAGEDPSTWSVGGNPSLVDYLAANAGTAASCTDYARMVLAIVAAGQAPDDFGGRDFVALLKGTYDGTQMADETLLNDDFWAVMALVAAGESGSVEVANSVEFILTNQNADGGWSWGVGQASDVDDTAAAIMALRAAGQPASLAVIQDGLDYLEGMQMDNGGFESWGATNAATDAWGVGSLVAAGEDPTAGRWTTGEGLDPIDDLLGFQNADGSFNWMAGDPMNTVLMTSYAIPALVSVPYPVVVTDEFDPWSYDADGNGEIDKVEALSAVADYFDETISKWQTLTVVALYFGQ